MGLGAFNVASKLMKRQIITTSRTMFSGMDGWMDMMMMMLMMNLLSP